MAQGAEGEVGSFLGEDDFEAWVINAAERGKEGKKVGREGERREIERYESADGQEESALLPR